MMNQLKIVLQVLTISRSLFHTQGFLSINTVVQAVRVAPYMPCLCENRVEVSAAAVRRVATGAVSFRPASSAFPVRLLCAAGCRVPGAVVRAGVYNSVRILRSLS